MNKVEFMNSIMDKMTLENGKCKICGKPTATFLKDDMYEVDNLILNACHILKLNPYREFSKKEEEYLTYIIAGMISTHKHIWMCKDCLELVDKQVGDSIIEKIINATKHYIYGKDNEDNIKDIKEINTDERLEKRLKGIINPIPQNKINYEEEE